MRVRSEATQDMPEPQAPRLWVDSSKSLRWNFEGRGMRTQQDVMTIMAVRETQAAANLCGEVETEGLNFKKTKTNY